MQHGSRGGGQQTNLADLAAIIHSWKWVVVAAVIIGGLIGLLYSWLLQPMYESRSVIQVGQPILEGINAIEAPEALVERLKEQYHINDDSEGPIAPPFLKDVRVNRTAKRMVTLTVYGTSGTEAKELLDKITNQVLDEYATVLTRYLSEMSHRFELYDKQIDDIGTQASALSVRVKEVTARGDLAAAVALTAERGELLQQLVRLEEQRLKVFTDLWAMDAGGTTRLIRKPTLTLGQASPKKTVFAVIGVFGGLVLGVLLAIILNNRSRPRTLAERYQMLP
jgi:uncharacterized protein involved in exopolysaccharide biosynthesis